MTHAFALPVPSAAGSLDHYVQTVNRFPLLTPEQELRLGRKLRDEDDLDAARQLVLSHLRVVVAIARGYLGYGLPQADLIQEGNIGLMKAVKRFDPERGVRLVSFAVHWIKAEIHEFILRNWRMVKIATTKAQRKLFFNLRSMKPGLGAADAGRDERDIATQLGVKPEEVVEMETRLARPGRRRSSPRSTTTRRPTPRSPIWPTRTTSLAGCSSDEQTERLRSAGLATALGALDAAQPPHHRSALAARDRTRRRCTSSPPSSGSAERIRQIEAKALQKMRGLDRRRRRLTRPRRQLQPNARRRRAFCFPGFSRV